LSSHSSTKKYWVKREDLVKLNFALVKHLPVLVFGQEKQGALQQLSMQIRNNAVPEVSTWITSVYMDNAQHEMYATRLRREEGARLLRLRWCVLPPSLALARLGG
jgi:SPX domain protein involved in polyphosphate accumulation